MNKHCKLNTPNFVSGLVLTAFSFALVIYASLANAQQPEPVKSTFVLWKDGSFDRTIVEKTTSYDQYNKIIFFPLRYQDLEIVTGRKAKLARNWEDFIDQDMPIVEEKFTRAIQNQFDEETIPALTEEGGPGVLVASVELLRLEPKAYRDSSLDTVGSETFETVGFLEYQIALMDSSSGIVVGLIEDRVQVSLKRKTKNIRSNHYQAWSRTFEYIVSHFVEDFQKLKQQSPLAQN